MNRGRHLRTIVNHDQDLPSGYLRVKEAHPWFLTSHRVVVEGADSAELAERLDCTGRRTTPGLTSE